MYVRTGSGSDCIKLTFFSESARDLPTSVPAFALLCPLPLSNLILFFFWQVDPLHRGAVGRHSIGASDFHGSLWVFECNALYWGDFTKTWGAHTVRHRRRRLRVISLRVIRTALMFLIIG